MDTSAPDPLPGLIADLLNMEGMRPDTRLLIEMAIEAQRTGKLPDLKPLEFLESDNPK